MPRVPFSLCFLGVKLLDIGLVTMYYFVLAIAVARITDTVAGKFIESDYKDVPQWALFLEILLQLFIIGVVAYILRNIVSMIPFPLDGVAGYNHFRLKELEGGEIMAVILILFQRNLFEKISYFLGKHYGG